MSNKKHDFYRLFPSHDLTNEVRVASNGAVYHLSWIKELLQRDGMRTNWEDDSGLTDDRRRRLGEDVNQFHWHLRAFFWELNATFDTLLHWMNQTYQLGIPESDVHWTRVIDASVANDAAEWQVTVQVLRAAFESSWCFEIRQYRHFAHRASLLNVAVLKDGEMMQLSLFPVRDGQPRYVPIVDQLVAYGTATRTFIEELLRRPARVIP